MTNEIKRVRRGCWDYYARRCRAACRNWYEPGWRDYYLSFRPVFRLKKKKR